MLGHHLRTWIGDTIAEFWKRLSILAAIGPDSRRAKNFGSFGAHSIICFPSTTIFNEQYIHIGSNTMIGE
ncbi:MAG: acyltransferase, partial [Ilumatobacteraceae bacterium]